MDIQKFTLREPGPREHADNELDSYRAKVYFWFSALAAAILLPFAVNGFIVGRYPSAWIATTLIAFFLINLVARLRKTPPPIPPTIYFIPVQIAMIVNISNFGVAGTFWAYPAIFLFQMVLPERTALLFTLITSALVAYLAFRYLDIEIAVRVAASLALTAAFAVVSTRIMKNLQYKLYRHSIMDSLTGVFNRRFMEITLAHAIEESKRYGTPCSIVIFDIDSFKAVNDDLGHDGGDGVLVGLAHLVRGSLRQSDLTFRIGGEEFLAYLPRTPLAGAANIAEMIRTRIAGEKLLDDRTITVSAGVCELAPGENLRSFLKRGDMALYRAKQEGRNRVITAAMPGQPDAALGFSAPAG